MKVWEARSNLSYVAVAAAVVAIDSSWNLIEQAILNHWAILIESAPICQANNVLLIDIFCQSIQVLLFKFWGALLRKMQIS